MKTSISSMDEGIVYRMRAALLWHDSSTREELYSQFSRNSVRKVVLVMALSADSLRNIFRQIPSMVGVLTATDSTSIFSSTISSLVSIDIDAQEPVVCFVLKKESLIGKIIREGNPFSISLLDENQTEISSKFALPRGKTSLMEPGFEYEKHGNDTFGISGCFIFIKASYIKMFDEYESNLYIVSVENSQINRFKSPLLYQDRTYGEFQKFQD
jgi:flavin reductase (DIM6/NTAB) family NADH-FMN oxidoreductase RutF